MSRGFASNSGSTMPVAVPLSRSLPTALLLAGFILGCGGGSSTGVSPDKDPTDHLAPAVSVSGTIAYGGALKGPIYVTLQDASGGGTFLGTALSAPGPYTIQGVPSGVYNLSASLDRIGNGTPNANDPAPSAPLSVIVSGQSVTGQDLALVDPSVDLSHLDGPTFDIWPMDSGAVLTFFPITETLPATDQDGECSLGYVVEWSTAPDFSVQTGSTTFPAQAGGSGFAILQGTALANGSALYFRMRALGTASASRNSTLASPVTIGPPSGGRTIRGTVTFTGTPTGPLYVCCQGPAGDYYATRVPAPVSPQAFTITGVPDGFCNLWVVLDENGNGVPDAGDFTNFQDWAPPFQVGAATPSQDVAITCAPQAAAVTTYHYQTDSAQDDYLVSLSVADMGRHVLATTLLSGPEGTVAPQDLGNSGQGFSALLDMGATVPRVGDTFRAQVTYSDGTSAILAIPITGVLEHLPGSLRPDGTASAGTVPTFSWAPPADLPSPCWYNLYVWSNTLGTAWATDWLPSTATSVTYGADPTDPTNTADPLTAGATYDWMLTVADANGNMGLNQLTFVP
jgi:hypothetical protein